MHLETVKIVAAVSDDNPLGYIIINKSDLRPEDKIFDPNPPNKAEKPAADKPAGTK